LSRRGGKAPFVKGGDSRAGGVRQGGGGSRRSSNAWAALGKATLARRCSSRWGGSRQGGVRLGWLSSRQGGCRLASGNVGDSVPESTSPWDTHEKTDGIQMTPSHSIFTGFLLLASLTLVSNTASILMTPSQSIFTGEKMIRVVYDLLYSFVCAWLGHAQTIET
jgi:hypothetical protein